MKSLHVLAALVFYLKKEGNNIYQQKTAKGFTVTVEKRAFTEGYEFFIDNMQRWEI